MRFRILGLEDYKDLIDELGPNADFIHYQGATTHRLYPCLHDEDTNTITMPITYAEMILNEDN